MRLLLDSHTIIWWLAEDPRVKADVRALIGSRRNETFLSVASVWEIGIKTALGKLRTPGDLPEQMAANDIRPLTITMNHAQAAASLPHHHRDPFDRMLIAQARIEDLTLVTRDANISAYDVRVLMV
jgi:PIN domain nuclease of toxin-antitoxin system